MNTIVPERHIPSHQGPDAQTVVPDVDVITIAAKAAHTQTHNHYWIVELTWNADRGEIVDAKPHVRPIFDPTPGGVSIVRIRRRTHATQSTTTRRIFCPVPMPHADAPEQAHRPDRHATDVTQRGANMNHKPNEQRRPDEMLTFDVVCGQLVDTTATEHARRFQNEAFYFCCAKCKSAFDATPERYVRSDAYGPFH